MELDNTKKLYVALLDDILDIFMDQFMENNKKTKSGIEIVISKGISYKVELLKKLLIDVKSRLNEEILKNMKGFFLSAKNIDKGKLDFISKKDELSLMAYFYCLIDTFNYLVRKKKQALFQLNEVKYKNFHLLVEKKGLEKKLKGTLNQFYEEIEETEREDKDKDKNLDITITILEDAKKRNFENIINIDDKDDKDDKELELNLKGKNVIQNRLRKEIDSKKDEDKDKNINYFNINDNNNISDGETTENTIENDNVLEALNSMEIDPKLKVIFSLIMDKNKKLENEFKKLENELKKVNDKINQEEKNRKNENLELQNYCRKLEDNLDELWNYFNLISNGRDITKSIVFFLYDYLGLKEENKNDKKLSEIIELLKNGKFDKNKITVDKDKLEKFLYLNLFLNKFYNKIVHRDAKVENNTTESGKIKIVGKYEFGEYFKNLALFLNKTIKEKGIQKIIYKKIENYEK